MMLTGGTKRGTYNVVAVIGAGGMGEVYRDIAAIYGLDVG